MTSILLFSGSARAESINQKLVSCAAQIATDKGAQVKLISLADYAMPLYNGDDEAARGIPENAQKLYNEIKAHDAMIIASPEYNGLPTPLLKNTIDWVSRVDVKVYQGKVAGLLAASPGGQGGMRGLPHLRTLLDNINTLVVPQQAAIGGAMDAFDKNGALKDERNHTMVEAVVDAVIAASQ